MVSWTAISSGEHADAYWRPRQGFSFAAEQHVVEVLIEELTALIPHYACGFIKDEAGSYRFIAILGLGGERNLFVNLDNKWLCDYVPAALRAYPFALADKPGATAGEKILCIEAGHLTIESEATRIFDDDGNLDSEVAGLLDFLNKCDKGRTRSQGACAALKEAGVISPWELSINRGEDQEPQKVKDIYRIDESALNKLDGSVLADLQNSGALAMAYGQLFSMHQIRNFDKNLKFLAQQQQQSDSQSSVAGLFGEDEGSLNFDEF